MLTISITTRTI